jgi:hypothetical protein
MQAVDHAFLRPVRLAGQPWVLKALQASEDRIAIETWGKKPDRFESVVATLGRILAWDQLRACGRGGAADADALIEFGQSDDWGAEMLAAAAALATTTRQQWQAFKAAVPDAG